MSSVYLAISLLKQSNIPEIQLKILLSYLHPKALYDYLEEEGIYLPNKDIWKKFLVDMIVRIKLIKAEYTEQDKDLPPERIYELIHEN